MLLITYSLWLVLIERLKHLSTNALPSIWFPGGILVYVGRYFWYLIIFHCPEITYQVGPLYLRIRSHNHSLITKLWFVSSRSLVLVSLKNTEKTPLIYMQPPGIREQMCFKVKDTQRIQRKETTADER